MAEDFSLGAKIVIGCMQLVAATHCVREYLVDVSICSGPSMIPTISGEGEVGKRASILGKHGAGKRLKTLLHVSADIYTHKSGSGPLRFMHMSALESLLGCIVCTVLVDRISPRMKQISVGDLVSASSPNNPYVSILKRVCGMVRFCDFCSAKLFSFMVVLDYLHVFFDCVFQPA